MNETQEGARRWVGVYLSPARRRVSFFFQEKATPVKFGKLLVVRAGFLSVPSRPAPPPLAHEDDAPHARPARYTPSPEEIAKVCGEIRRGWDERTREQRFVGGGREAWSVPTMDLSELPTVV